MARVLGCNGSLRKEFHLVASKCATELQLEGHPQNIETKDESYPQRRQLAGLQSVDDTPVISLQILETGFRNIPIYFRQDCPSAHQETAFHIEKIATRVLSCQRGTWFSIAPKILSPPLHQTRHQPSFLHSEKVAVRLDLFQRHPGFGWHPHACPS